MKISIKAARINAGYTQTQAAELIGVSPVTIFNWESGNTSPTVKRLEKLCEVYGVGKDQLRLGDEK